MGRSLFILSVVGVGLTAIYAFESIHYPWGTLAQPGPGFYPAFVAVFLIAGFLGTGLEGLLAKSSRRVEWPKGDSFRRVLVIAGGGMGYVFLLPVVGHPVAGGMVTLIVLQAMKLPSWPLKIGLSAANGVGSFFLFSTLLGVPLPLGFWW